MSKVHDLSLTLANEEIQAEPKRFTVQASDADRAALVERFNIVALDKLTAKVEVRADARAEAIVVSGHVGAELSQQCIVTLEDVPESISEDFELMLVSPETADRYDEDELYLDPEAPEYDAFEGDEVPVGEIVAQTLSVMMNPYPKKEGAEIPVPKNAGVSVNEELEKKPNPFAALSKLRDKS